MTPATPETLAAVLKAAKSGDVLQLVGTFPAFRCATWPGGKLSGLTLDFAGATLTGPFDVANLADCTFTGGKVASVGKSAALLVSKSARIAFTGMEFDAGMTGQGYGVAAEEVEGLTVTGCTFNGLRAGLKLGKIRGADIARNEFVNAGSDGVNMGDCWDVDIHHNWFWKFAPLPGNHPDPVQCNTATDRYPRCQRVTVRDNVIEGECQGMLIRDTDGVLVARNSIRVGQPTAIGLQNCTAAVIEDNGYLRTLETAPYQAHIDQRGSTVTYRGFNEAPAFRNTKRAAYPEGTFTVAK